MTTDALIVFVAQYLIWFIVGGVVLVFLAAPRDQQKQAIIRFLIVGALAYVFFEIASWIYFDPRPFTRGATALFYHEANNGFPSRHTVFGVSIALLTLPLSRKAGIAFLILAVSVGAARALANVHSPLQIGAGILIACAAYGVGTTIMSRFKAIQPRQLPEPEYGDTQTD